MSLFQDDFYSTKVKSRQDRRDVWDRGRSRPPVWMVAGLSFVLGVVLTLAAVLPLESKDEPVVETAMAPMDQPLIDPKISFQEMIIDAADKVHPTVVSVISGAKEKDAEEMLEYGLGSGIIFEKSGGQALIVTNAHVIGAGEYIEVVLSTGDRKEAVVIGQDTLTDLAVLQINDEGIRQVAEFGDSSLLQAGETAIAIGNPLGLGFSHTITVGVISAPSREIDVSPEGQDTWKMDVIQTDAAINQGNSGGALVNLDGQVIGINSLKILDMGVEGLGFAIPINEAQPIIQDLVDYGKVKRPYLGIYTQNLEEIVNREELNLPDEVNTGIIVLEAVGPAKDAGLLSGDVIVELDGEPSRNTYELRKYLYESKEIGDEVVVTYYRDEERIETTVTLTEWDPESAE